MSGRRDALEAAYDKLENGGDEPEETGGHGHADVEEGAEGAAREGQQESAEQKGQEVEDAAGGKEKPEKASTDRLAPEDKKDQQEGKGKDKALERASQAAAGTGAETGKAPVSWKPAVKEQWNALPVDVRQEILRREKEMSQFISNNDHHRKFSEGFAKTVQPFAHLIQAQGSTPLQAVRNLFTTAAGLSTGNSEQKARIVAEIISNYGVDIDTLDKVLSGGAPAPQAQAMGSIHPSVLQALQPVYGFMNEVQQARQMREQRQQQEAVELVEKSSDLPYFDDLREDMADLMDIAAKRGVEMNIQQAYEKALALNPEISQIVARQKAIEEAKRNGGTRVARARRAASTLTGAPAGTPGNSGAPKTRRDALLAAWDEADSA